MKVRSLLFSTLCMLAISVTFTSCSDDDDAPWNDEGTKVELPQRRMFILNEGKADNNNAGIAFMPLIEMLMTAIIILLPTSILSKMKNSWETLARIY